MTRRILRNWAPALYTAAVFCFVFLPIAASLVFSLTSARFPTLPLAEFSLDWYARIWDDPAVWTAFANSAKVSISVGAIATVLGFGAAYTDYRYQFIGKNAYLAIALLPPTIPLIVLGLAMLAFLSRISLSGALHSVVISHSVLCAPFAMAVIRLRLSQIDPALEAASWNLGASQWKAMRYVIVPFARPAIASAFFLTAAVSFDEFAIAWFVSGLNETVPVRILTILQGSVTPEINAIGSIVFGISIVLVLSAQIIFMQSAKRSRLAAGNA